MIEFKETFTFEGLTVVKLVADGLPARCNPKDYKYTITVWPEGHAVGKSRSCGNGSVRYHHFKTYAEAQEHAVTWAKRKIAEERKAAELRANDEIRLRAHQAAFAS
jgi:hypothetical protein